jgi:hypothetical protein
MEMWGGGDLATLTLSLYFSVVLSLARGVVGKYGDDILFYILSQR